MKQSFEKLWMDSSTNPESWKDQRATILALKNSRPQPKCLSATCKAYMGCCTRMWEGWDAYCRHSGWLASLASLYMTALGFDCIAPGYADSQGFAGSLLSIHTALSAAWPRGNKSLDLALEALWLGHQRNHFQLALHRETDTLCFLFLLPF